MNDRQILKFPHCDFLPKKHSLQITVWNRLRQVWLLLFLEDFFVNSRNQNLGQQSTWSSLSFWSEQHKKIRSFSPFFSSKWLLISVDLGWTLMMCFWLFCPFFGEVKSSFVSLLSQKSCYNEWFWGQILEFWTFLPKVTFGKFWR